MAGFIAECIKKRNPISVMLRAVIKPLRPQLNSHAMPSGTLEKSHTNVISVTRLLSDMMISNDITAFTLVSACTPSLLVPSYVSISTIGEIEQ